MREENVFRPEVESFLFAHIDTIPHLEALLLLWNHRPRFWSLEELARSLYIPNERAHRIVRDLIQKGLVQESSNPGGFGYNSCGEHDALLPLVDVTYRQQLIRVTTMIHSKAPSAMRDFARAFRFKKEKE
jgi:hypothetical protein